MTDSNLLSDMANDSEEIKKSFVLNDELLTTLAELVNKQISIEETITEYTECLEKLNEDLKAISEFKIPEIFDGLGLSEIKLKDGRKVSIKRGYAATISEDNKEACFEWLKETNNDGIIKHDVTVKLKKGESDDHKKIVEFIQKEGLSYEDKEHVHPATLKSFVNEQITNGVAFPMDLFKVFPICKTKIK